MGTERTMCVILYVPTTKSVSKDRLKNCYENNPDGCGFMWANGGRLNVRKGCWSFDDFYLLWHIAAYKVSPNSSFILHFRTATSGSKNRDQCHPFLVNDDLGFAHNGNLFEFSGAFSAYQKDNQSLSDTQRFNKDVLKRMPGNFLKNKRIKDALEAYCFNNFSKMIFMDNSGHVTIINEQAGQWEGGVFFSNGGIDDYTGYGYSGAYEYRPNDVRHKGGLISAFVFSENKRINWRMCEVCKGWYAKYQLRGNLCYGCIILENLKGVIK